MLAILALTMPLLKLAAAEPTEVRSSAHAGGGGTVLGAEFRLDATIGQTDATTSAGSNFETKGGFWPSVVLDLDPSLFEDGFESGSFCAWTTTVGVLNNSSCSVAPLEPTADTRED